MNDTLNDLKNFYHKISTIEGLLNVFINIFGNNELKEKDFMSLLYVIDDCFLSFKKNIAQSIEKQEEPETAEKSVGLSAQQRQTPEAVGVEK